MRSLITRIMAGVRRRNLQCGDYGNMSHAFAAFRHRAKAVRLRSDGNGAFTLAELIVVIGVILTLGALSGPAMRSLGGMGTNKASEDLARTVELARTYAMANQTYVRLAISDELSTATVVLPIFSADGTLDADGAADMADAAKWPAMQIPMVLTQFRIDNTLNATSPGTTGDQVPSGSNIAAMRRRIQGLGTNAQGLLFNKFIQFNPNGEARVEKGVTARYIKLGMLKSEGYSGGTANPFIVRVSGVNGTISVLRKDQGVTR